MDLIIHLLNDIIQDIRNISHGMSFENFENNNLCELIHNTTDVLSCRIKIITDCYLNQSLSSWHKINLFRITQELLTNTIKHAKAKEIKIQLHNRGREFVLLYQDNGKGLINMREGMGLKTSGKKLTP